MSADAIQPLLDALPPVYDHTPSLLLRAAGAGPIRAIATRAWADVMRRPERAGFTLTRHLRAARSRLRSWERRLVAAGLYALVRSHALLADALDTAPDDARGLWLGWLVHQGLPPDDAARHADGRDFRLAAALRQHADERLRVLSPAAQLALGGSLPGPVAERLVADLGAAGGAFVAASNRRAPLVLRVNHDRTSREAVLAALTAAGIAALPGPQTPWAIELPGRLDVRRLGLYRDGAIEVQDAGSQRVAAFVGAAPGETVVDLCAGTGGKTLVLAAAVGARGRVVASDLHPERLVALSQRAARAGVAERLELADLPADGTADRVLVDAPCSGSGTLRRDPALRWRLGGRRIERLGAVQAELITRAAALVRPGGGIVYATCSVFRAENEAQVDTFLAGDRRFEPDPDGALLRLGPHTDDTDGFFAARLVRRR